VTSDSAFHLSVLAASNGEGDSPIVYETDRGTLVVQGHTVDPRQAGLTVPDGEKLVEIPAELLAELARRTIERSGTPGGS
jgi:hypothetical protein